MTKKKMKNRMRFSAGMCFLMVLGVGMPAPAMADSSWDDAVDTASPVHGEHLADRGEVLQQVPPIPAPGGEWEHTHEGPLGETSLRLERQLRCNCGCMLDVHSCQYQMQCGTSPQWSERIQRLLEEGESEEAILAGFTADFGPNVLMTLPTEGFNWVGYLLPWMAILAAAAGVVVFLRRRVATVGTKPEPSSMTLEEWDRIQEELRRLEEEERADDF